LGFGNHWRKEIQTALNDKVILMLIKDESTRLTSLRTGKLDLMMGVNWKNVEELKRAAPVEMGRHLSTGNFTVALRMDQKPFNDIGSDGL